MPQPSSYRDNIAPALIDRNMPSNGRAQAAEQLASTFRNFAQKGTQIVGDLRAEQGRREGAEAGRTDNPSFRTGMSSTTAYGQAYNDTSMRSYAIKSEISADEAATRLELEAGNDPEHFRVAFGARRDETIKNAPPEARAVLGEVYDRRMAAGMQRLIGAQSMEIRKQARADVSEGLTRSTDRLAQLRASNDPALHAQADEEQVKIDLMIDGAVRDGTISKLEGGSLKVDSMRATTAQTMSYRFKGELNNPYGNPVKFIMDLKEYNKTNETLPPDEEDKLVAALLNDLQEHNALMSAGLKDSNLEQKRRWETGDNAATKALMDGSLTIRGLSRMLGDDGIDPAVARSLRSALESGSDTPDDNAELLRVEPHLLEYSEQDLIANTRLSLATRRRLVLERQKQAAGWRGSQQASEGVRRISSALKIVPGADRDKLTEKEAAQYDSAMKAFYEQVEALPEDKRQAAIISTADEIVENVIKGKAAAKLETTRRRLDKARAANESRLEDMDEAERKKYDADIARMESQIRTLEQQAK
jgi:hypothetical protein